MLRTWIRHINLVTVAALVLCCLAVMCTAQNQQQQPQLLYPLQRKTAGILCNEFRKIRELIPSELLIEITAKHYRYDAKFRHAMKFMHSQEFANAAEEIEDSDVYKRILLQFRKAGIKTADISSMSAILNCFMMPMAHPDKQADKNDDGKLVEKELEGDTSIKSSVEKEPAKDTLIKYNFEKVLVKDTLIKPIVEKDFEKFMKQLKDTLIKSNMEREIANDTLTTPNYIETASKEADMENKEKQPLTDTETQLIIDEETKLVDKEIGKNFEDDYDLNQHWDEEDFDDYEDSFEIVPNMPIQFGISARTRSKARMRPFVSDVMRAIPRKELRNLLKADLIKSPELVKFYNLLRNTAFRRKVKRSLRSVSLKEPLTTMKRNFIDVPRLVSAFFKVFSWGPRRIRTNQKQQNFI